MALPLVHLDDVDPYPGGAERVTVLFGDKQFTAGRRTAAHLLYTEERFENRFPDARIHVAQSCYHTGYKLSEGTHDGDGTLDFVVLGLNDTETNWYRAQRLFRECGWDAWFRHTGSWAPRYRWHIHANSDGCPGPVGYYIPGQHSDYRAHAFGLEGHHTPGSDDSWFPPNIAAVRFDYSEWEEDHMDNATKDDIAERAADKVIAKLLAYKPGNDDDTVKQILNRLSTDQERQ